MDWSLGKQEDFRAGLAQLDLPVLWLTGKRDEKFTALAAEVVPKMPQGRHVTVMKAGHRVPWEDPECFCEAVGIFLAQFGG